MIDNIRLQPNIVKTKSGYNTILSNQSLLTMNSLKFLLLCYPGGAYSRPDWGAGISALNWTKGGLERSLFVFIVVLLFKLNYLWGNKYQQLFLVVLFVFCFKKPAKNRNF